MIMMRWPIHHRGLARLRDAAARTSVLLGLLAGACSDEADPGPPDATQPDGQAAAPPPAPQCPPGPWLKVLLRDGAAWRWQCAPDFPVWGDQPLAPQSLTLNGDGTAADSLTGLQWQVDPATAMVDHASAATQCDALALGGHGDWRLPTVAELQSLVDYERHHPALAAPLPPPLAPAEFWTLPQRGALGWSVEFQRGQIRQRPRHLPLQVRCVRSDRPASVGYADRFTFQNKETAADALLHLEWLRNVVVNTYTLPSTVGWCNKLDLAGSGWRVPTLRQLSALVDRSAVPGMVDPSVFGGATATIWSYTLSADDPGYVWTVDFGHGTCAAMQMQSYQDLRCVRDLP